MKAQQRESERARRAVEKAQKEKYIQTRQQETDRINHEIEARLTSLRKILDQALTKSLTFRGIVEGVKDEALVPQHPGTPPQPPLRSLFENRMPKASILERLTGIGKKARLRKIEQIEQEYQESQGIYKRKKNRYDEQLQQREQFIAHLQEGLTKKAPSAVQRYFRLVLEQSTYPAGFPKHGTLAYNPETSELIIEYELPSYEAIMPTVRGYKYIKSRDEVQELPFTKTYERELKALYEEVIAAVALRTLHEIFKADPAEAIQSVVFNGMVNAIDKATGQPIRPCLISVQTTREEFTSLNLAQVDKKACLNYLKAQTSPSSKELVAIKPIAELPKEDSRFVDEIDMLSTLDSRVNLLEMDPIEFEHLIANLFAKMDLETHTTRRSKDGGVDVIAFDDRPILGGKVVIQAKRYRNTVEVESVRALYGVMQDEGATKGILVTTSSFGAASRQFAKDKPIELIDGNKLLYLLQEHGYNVKIEIPK